MDKAPDAFRTISEVADELDIPQHVLRFWETRFAQIKPMKRSGGRRYYRPDDVDLLKGIRRLLYGEGYTIRGVQRILKEHGIKSVQGIADHSASVSFGAVEEAVGHSMAEPDDAEADGFDLDGEEGDGDEKGIDYRFVDPDEDAILSTYKSHAQPAKAPAPAPARVAAADRQKLERALQDLVACRQMLDAAMKDGQG
ncbi:MerR family transcriptional regulator [Bradyrhizobium jicamae]|uniref:MerR family transcriptional regulator n=1 Tax=Bradyrhizobium jicamae TaxID=280332 RepID=A0ABS5FH64_9BRAD|nr:MerR family transcriptional regulator [Bradyrhizobium jicamae]MBR0796120.1 MerR family transcriptional regulator [Bradyrhizobium jicamae]MBR0935719.1 MerR family transcriptional regulator [Bradyrhizobium jicamae]